MRKKDLESLLAIAKEEAAYQRERADIHMKGRISAERQLQRIRIAYEPLHEAIFPPTIKAAE